MLNPGLLKNNSLILVVSPSFYPDSGETQSGIESYRRLGYRVESGPNSLNAWGNFAGTDEQRLQDLQWALDHPEADVIICSRGGYGMGRIVRSLDFSGFQKKPKWLIGFSDITLLHLKLQELGFSGLHGPMLVHHARLAQMPACLKQQDFLIRRSAIRYSVENPFPEIQSAGISGIVVGGNLSLMCYGIAETSPVFFENKIVFLEETGEAYHKIDRMLDTLIRSGKLDKAAGFVLGTMDDCPKNGFPMEPAAMLREKIKPGQSVFSALPCGHKNPSFPLVLGYEAAVSATEKRWEFFQPALPLIS